ncbi:MAG: GUN4 domain-containing protein [Microcoleus sp.]
MKILFLAANPPGTTKLKLDEELKKIDDSLQLSKLRDQFQLVSKWAVDSDALRRALLREDPDIVHFSGHGEGQAGLVLVGQKGEPKPATAEALSGLFKLCPKVKCVLLNACYAEVQAKAIVKHIDYVIGMRQEVRDDAAIAFATGFYDGLCHGKPIDVAFEFGRSAINFELANFSSTTRKAIPVDLEGAKEKFEPLADHLIPVLLRKETSFLESSGNSAAPTTIQIGSLSEQLRTNQNTHRVESIKQYRDRVKEFLADRDLTPIEEYQLATLAKVGRLSETEANIILQEELDRIEQAKESYRQILTQTLQKGYYPFNETIQKQLKDLKDNLELTDGESEQISRIVFDLLRLEQTVEENLDIIQELALTAEEMSNGTERLIITEHDKITVKVPAQTTTGKRIRVRGKGKFSQKNQHRGDLYLTIVQSHNSLPNIQPKLFDDLSSERGIDYTILQNLLSRGRWAEADKETMQVLLSVVNRSQQGWLRLEDCVRFPCLDLCTINQLWVKYSAGRFSFAIQKQAWETVSRSAESKHIIRDFCRACGSAQIRKGAVGWWSGDKILCIEQIYERFSCIGTPGTSFEEFSIIPKGLLPAPAHWNWLETGRQASCLSAFFARLEDCNL